MKQLKRKYFYSAINLLKVFGIKEYGVRAIAVVNISFLHFPERNLNLNEDYAFIYVKTSRYNAKVLVNKVNCLFVNRDFKREKKYIFRIHWNPGGVCSRNI